MSKSRPDPMICVRTFTGGIDWLRERGIEVTDLDSDDCRLMLDAFITAHPELWHEDIGQP